MPGNYHKLWIQVSLNQVAITRALEQIQQLGRALPCRVKSVLGSIVQVEFGPLVTSPQTLPPVWMPVGAPQWLRYPLQEGDLGVTMPADTFLGGVSGLGDGLADTTVNYGNLTTLVFVPVGNTGFTAAPDANRIWLNGPNGTDFGDTDQTVGGRAVADTKTLTLYAGGNTVVITADPSITDSVQQAAGILQQIVSVANTSLQGIVPAGSLDELTAIVGGINAAIYALPPTASSADVEAIINAAEPALQAIIPSSSWGAITTILATATTAVAAVSALSSALSSVQAIIDGTSNAITQSVPNPDGSGSLQAKIDGVGNAISLIVPSVSGLVGLGEEAALIADSTRAVPSQNDLTTLSNNTISQTLQTLATAIGEAAVTAGIPSAAAFSAILGAAGWVAGLADINPTIPDCSSKVRVAE